MSDRSKVSNVQNRDSLNSTNLHVIEEMLSSNNSTSESTSSIMNLIFVSFVSSVGELRAYPNENKPDMGFMDVLEEYIHRDSGLKSIEMHKIVYWDYSYLTQSIVSIIRDQGYQHEIRITYLQRNQFIVRSNAGVLRLLPNARLNDSRDLLIFKVASRVHEVNVGAYTTCEVVLHSREHN
ncbi:1500_t:CDS:2 [Dentiscutata erythropus]|uniref:1500_t:CDS:1 n=1 Tax=Dentiscutata erythropus TaxID=1348616 RepID=A0A9N8WMS4_9GLOM|nr:1500_t:CDS:2 [Dentiscutata erythropus]